MALQIKKKLFILVAGLFVFGGGRAQSYELQRLILDIQKLAELKNILNDLYKGYRILETGYSTIKNISEGNFTLHKAFLDGLLLVSPTVRKYHRVQEIIDYQATILREYRLAFGRFRNSNQFRPEELVYISDTYRHLIDQTAKTLEGLVMVLTAGELRMSDAERLRRIDQLYGDAQTQFLFLRQFNNQTEILSRQRQRDRGDLQTTRQFYNIP